MNILITKIIGVKYSDEHDCTYDFEESPNIDREKYLQKELTTEVCSLVLMETILERFFDFAFSNLKKLVDYCMQNKWSNLSEDILMNLFAVIALLPKCMKNHNVQQSA